MLTILARSRWNSQCSRRAQAPRSGDSDKGREDRWLKSDYNGEIWSIFIFSIENSLLDAHVWNPDNEKDYDEWIQLTRAAPARVAHSVYAISFKAIGPHSERLLHWTHITPFFLVHKESFVSYIDLSSSKNASCIRQKEIGSAWNIHRKSGHNYLLLVQENSIILALMHRIAEANNCLLLRSRHCDDSSDVRRRLIKLFLTS